MFLRNVIVLKRLGTCFRPPLAQGQRPTDPNPSSVDDLKRKKTRANVFKSGNKNERTFLPLKQSNHLVT